MAQAALAKANLLMRTGVRRPVRVGVSPSVEGMVRAVDRPRRMLRSTVFVRASVTSASALVEIVERWSAVSRARWVPFCSDS